MNGWGLTVFCLGALFGMALDIAILAIARRKNRSDEPR